MPYPAWDLVPLRSYNLPLVNRSYVIVETSRGCPYSCDFCVAPVHQGHKFRERSAKALVDEIERGYREFGIDFFYLWGDTVTLNVKSFSAFCEELIARNLPVQWFGNARADNLTDPAFVHRLRARRLLDAGDGDRDRVRRYPQGHGQEARAAEDPDGDQQHARRRHPLVRVLHLRLPGRVPATIEQTIEYAIELNPDFANFYPAVPYPGTELYNKVVRDGLLVEEDWSRMEYSFYLLRGNGLDENVVMDAINRAKRRFFMRPAYLASRFGDMVKLATTKPSIFGQIATRTIFGSRVSAPRASRGVSAAR